MPPRTAHGILLLVPLLLMHAFCSCNTGSPAADGTEIVAPQAMAAALDGTRLLVTDTDPNIIWCNLKYGFEYGSRQELLENFLATVKKQSLAQCSFNNGRSLLKRLENGRYWIISAAPVPTDAGEQLLWSLPLVVRDGSTVPSKVVLHRSNAALVISARDVRPQ